MLRLAPVSRCGRKEGKGEDWSREGGYCKIEYESKG